MTESEAWDSLAAHLQEKNYTGVLVIADWFQENGWEAVAVYLRWAEKKSQLPTWQYPLNGPKWVIYPVNRQGNYYLALYKELAEEVVYLASELEDERKWYSD